MENKTLKFNVDLSMEDDVLLLCLLSSELRTYRVMPSPHPDSEFKAQRIASLQRLIDVFSPVNSLSFNE